MKKYLLSLPVLLFTLLILYKVNSNAYIYVFLVLLFYCAVVVYLEKKERLKRIFIYMGSSIFALFIAELYYSFQYDQFTREYEIVYGDNVTRNLPIIGMVPHENSQVVSQARMNDELIYEVKITIDQYGRRIMPEREFQSNEAVLFLGGSFTLGDGVEDHGTLPFQFQEAAQGRYRAYNFGFSGNGAHQTLAILENELEKRGRANSTSKIGVYSIITDHIMRGTYSDFNTHSPKYRFDENGVLYNAGVFSTFRHKVSHYLGKSNLNRALAPLFQPEQKDVDLMLSMTARSAEIFEERYGAKFYCQLWRLFPEEHEGWYEKVLQGLKDRGIDVIEIEDIIPDYSQNPEKYTIHSDGHPNSLANKMIGRFLVDFLDNQ